MNQRDAEPYLHGSLLSVFDTDYEGNIINKVLTPIHQVIFFYQGEEYEGKHIDFSLNISTKGNHGAALGLSFEDAEKLLASLKNAIETYKGAEFHERRLASDRYFAHISFLMGEL